jgi:hypothetical protein
MRGHGVVGNAASGRNFTRGNTLGMRADQGSEHIHAGSLGQCAQGFDCP